MKVLSYNLISGGYDSYESEAKRPEKLELLADVLKEEKADWVSLVDTYRWVEDLSIEEIKKATGYKNVFISHLDDTDEIRVEFDSGMAILTDLNVKNIEIVRIGSRNAIKAIVIDKDKEIEIWTIYLNPTSENIRMVQAEELLKKIDITQPTLIMGDFNSIKKGELKWWTKMGIMIGGLWPPWTRHIKTVFDMNQNKIVEMFEEKGLNDAGDTHKSPTIPSKYTKMGIFGPFLRLDYMFYSKLNVNNFEVLKGGYWNELSDHYPITAEIE